VPIEKVPLEDTKEEVDKEDIDLNTELTRKLDGRYCILLDGIFTYLPTSAVASGSKTRAIGRFLQLLFHALPDSYLNLIFELFLINLFFVF
jgi:hypothetical protein